MHEHNSLRIDAEPLREIQLDALALASCHARATDDLVVAGHNTVDLHNRTGTAQAGLRGFDATQDVAAISARCVNTRIGPVAVRDRSSFQRQAVNQSLPTSQAEAQRTLITYRGYADYREFGKHKTECHGS